MSANLSEQDHELLSAYIDGELSDAERLGLEIRLDAETDLRRELETMRQTVALIDQLPRLKAPRNFTLVVPPQKVVRKLPVFLTSTFSALSAAAAVLLLLFGGYLLVGSSMSSSAPQQTMSVALQVTATPKADDGTFTQLAEPAIAPTQQPAPAGGMANTAPPIVDNAGSAGADSDQAQEELAASSEMADTLVQTEEMMAAPKETDEAEMPLAVMPYDTAPAGTLAFGAASATDAGQVQRQTTLPTLTFPSNVAQATDATTGQARTITLSNNTVALVVLGAGIVLLVVAIVTTRARRNARA